MNNRQALQNIAEDLVRMEGISRSIKSGNQQKWVRNTTLINKPDHPLEVINSVILTNRIIARMMSTSR
ncbi:hypothetical protein [Endozoicomonas euniceicola]|uniref:Uncharacterized protein n=1 Tax=Endozoicomonas euniceicola TaxID=1234143 RepID=A0ABY6GNJ9_9GAMM|nr:hypothetical protein [Endozoicomonas euniceicola]UYM14288.1 hypothetical protein NX720_15425 [Endozoicomonas euniceicola]